MYLLNLSLPIGINYGLKLFMSSKILVYLAFIEVLLDIMPGLLL